LSKKGSPKTLFEGKKIGKKRQKGIFGMFLSVKIIVKIGHQLSKNPRFHRTTFKKWPISSRGKTNYPFLIPLLWESDNYQIVEKPCIYGQTFIYPPPYNAPILLQLQLQMQLISKGVPNIIYIIINYNNYFVLLVL